MSQPPEPGRPRDRVRSLGIAPGVLPPGPLNAITDVAGLRVGHLTLVEGEATRTGVTAILPHGDNVFLHRVPAGLAVGNGFGKLTGVTQLVELGELETPLVLTNTLVVPRAADALISYALAQPGNKEVRSVNPLVGECNDGLLNDIRYAEVRETLAEFGFTAHIRGRGEEAKELAREAGKRARRWVVERSHGWMNRFRRILVRWEWHILPVSSPLRFTTGRSRVRGAR